MKKDIETPAVENKSGVIGKVVAIGTIIVTGAVQAQAAILPVDAALDTAEYLAVAGVVGVAYLFLKGPEKALGLLRRF